MIVVVSFCDNGNIVYLLIICDVFILLNLNLYVLLFFCYMNVIEDWKVDLYVLYGKLKIVDELEDIM